MRGLAGAVALMLLVVVGAPALAAVDDGKLEEAKRAGDEFMKRVQATGKPPRESDPEIATLLGKVFDAGILGTEILPLSETNKVVETMQNGNRVGIVYIFDGTDAKEFSTTDPKVLAKTDQNTVTYQPEIGRWLDFEIVIEDALIKSALKFLDGASEEVLKRPAVVNGLAQMRGGLSTSLNGMLKTIALPGVSDSWRLARTASLNMIAGDTARFLPRADAVKIADFADTVSGAVQSAEVKARLAEFSRRLRTDPAAKP